MSMLPSTHSTVSANETYISELNTDSACSLSTLNRVTFSAQDSLSGDWLNLASVGVPPTGVVRPYLGAPNVVFSFVASRKKGAVMLWLAGRPAGRESVVLFRMSVNKLYP